MKQDYKITREKFFDTQERRKILANTEDFANADKAKGRQTWQVRWMLVHLAFYSGLRVSEISKLQLKDVYLQTKAPYLFVRQGKRGKDRDVYIDRNLVKHLKEFIQLKKLLNQSTEPDSYLFSGHGEKQITTTALTMSFKAAVLKAGLRDNLSIHSARHTYATVLYHKTKNLRYVQKQLGHAGINMTSLYADVMPEENGVLANQILED